MKTINEKIIKSNQNKINYLNAKIMFKQLDFLLKRYDNDYIYKETFKTEEECIKNYVLNSNAIRLACEVCEHYIKAMLIDRGQTWDEMRAFGHNLLFLMESMDKKDRNQIVSNLLPLYTDKIKLTKEEKQIFKCMMTHKPNKNIMGVTVKAEKYYIDKNLEKQEQNQIKKITESFLFDDLNIMFSYNNRKQDMTIKSRYPGAYLITAKADIIISLAYTLNKMNEKK